MRTLERAGAIAAGGAHARQSGVGRLPVVRQRGVDPPLAADVPQRRTARLDRRPPAGQPVDRRRGRVGRRRDGPDERAVVPQRHGDRDRCADPPRGHQQLPARWDADARRHRRGDHDADPAAALRRAMAPVAARRDPRRRRVGVRARRLPRHPTDDRHHRRAAGDARHRHRLRHPAARARRGGGDPRPLRPSDPGDGAQPRPGAARRHVRRRVRLPRPALRQGADDPRLRPVARRRHRRHLPQLDRHAARRPRRARVPLTDEGSRLP